MFFYWNVLILIWGNKIASALLEGVSKTPSSLKFIDPFCFHCGSLTGGKIEVRKMIHINPQVNAEKWNKCWFLI